VTLVAGYSLLVTGCGSLAGHWMVDAMKLKAESAAAGGLRLEAEKLRS